MFSWIDRPLKTYLPAHIRGWMLVQMYCLPLLDNSIPIDAFYHDAASGQNNGGDTVSN